MKRLFVILSIVLIMIMMCASVVSAADYSTSNYDVQINVKEDNSAYITEKISVNIANSIHGIYKYIPLSQTIQYKDGDGNTVKKVHNPMKIKDISVANYKYETYKENGNMVIKVGDSDKYVDGKKTYNLSYLAAMYDDGIKKYDSFYYNVLPFDWETPIENSKITIVMPKSFNTRDVDVSAGTKGSRSETKKIKTSIEGNTITIKTKETLSKGSGITVGIKLPEGYYSGELSTLWMKVLMCVVPLLFAIILGLLWFKFGRDPKHVQTVEFEAPEGISPAELGYIIDGSVDKKDVVSLLFWFAQKGYISIEESGKKDFILHKEKDLPIDAKAYEKTFFNGLFKDSLAGNITLSKLGDDFYETYEKTKEEVKNEFVDSRKNRIFPSKAIASRGGGFVLLIIGMLFSGLVTGMMFSNLLLYMIPAAVIGILMIVGIVTGIVAIDKRFVEKKSGEIGKIAFSLLFLLISIILSILLMWLGIGFVFGGIALAVLEAVGYFALVFMQSRTKRGAELLGKILGFKEFIRLAEVEKLEMMVEENPEYFYEVLPYAYVFGLSKKWSKKFESIPTEQPYWYRSTYGNNSMFNTWIFFSAFNHCTNFANSTIGVPPVNSGIGSGGGSFGGGGGFSGGGFGGGGGGSW